MLRFKVGIKTVQGGTEAVGFYHPALFDSVTLPGRRAHHVPALFAVAITGGEASKTDIAGATQSAPTCCSPYQMVKDVERSVPPKVIDGDRREFIRCRSLRAWRGKDKEAA
jgi:hypothetical protein